MAETILVIEDDSSLAKGLERALSSENCQVISCGRLSGALKAVEKNHPDLILLDVNLPDGNGFEFLTELKDRSEVSDIPVIMLTANDMETDIVSGLELGADDYVTKPFSLAVLRARINAQLRKNHKNTELGKAHEVRCFGKYRFDFDRMKFYVSGELVELSKTEQKLLKILTDNADVTVSRSDLIDRIWTDGAEFVDENALSVAIKRLRDKLDASDRIKTVYGIGYTWIR